MAQPDEDLVRQLAAGRAREGQVHEPRGFEAAAHLERIPGEAARDADLRSDETDVGKKLVVVRARGATTRWRGRRTGGLLGLRGMGEDGEERETGDRPQGARDGLRDRPAGGRPAAILAW